MTTSWQTIGFEKNKIFFEALISSGRLGHAYLFSGQEMIGKRTFALELAHFITKSQINSPDVLVVDSAGSESGQTITIEEVRKIKSYTSLSPYASQRKFVVIDNAHLMTVEAQNALLKILEEPSESSIFILVSANLELLLPTIISRCQEISFFPHAKTAIAEILEASKLSTSQASFLTEFANGRMGLVKKIIEEKLFDEVKNSVEELMHLIKTNINERFIVAQKLSDDKKKEELPRKVLYWLLYLRTRINEPKAHKVLKNLLVLYETINRPQFNQRLALENFLVQI